MLSVVDVVTLTTPSPSKPEANDKFKHRVPGATEPVIPIFELFALTPVITAKSATESMVLIFVLLASTVGNEPPSNCGASYVTPVTISFASDVTVASVPVNVGAPIVPAGV